ncbi:MAG: nucleotidyltransferase family protein [Hyphomonadaceae bacterium]
MRLEADDSISLAAPFGLEDVFAMILRPNPKRGATGNTKAKVAGIQARWPEIQFKEA